MKLVHSSATPQSLAVWRVYLLGIFLVWMAAYDWSLLAWIPREQFRLSGVLKSVPFVFDFFFNKSVLHWLQAAAFVTAILGILNVCARWTVLLTALLNLIYYRLCISMDFSFHSGLGITFAAFILAGALFFEHRDQRRGDATNYAPATLQLTALALLTCYSIIGVHRITVAGMETLRADYLLGWFIERGGSGEFQYSLHLQDHPGLLRVLELGFPVITVMEALAPLALVSRPIKWLFLLTSVPFHFLTLFLMNIFFWQNLLILPLLLFDFSALFNPRVAGERAPVVYYDGVCALCNRWVQWVLRRDPGHVFRFAPLQGETAAGRFGVLQGDATSWTVFLEDDRGVHERSDAALRIISGLGGMYRFAALLVWIPGPLRDGVYRWVARNRYRWFGKHESCPLPGQAERSLFLP